jgi:signal transduction histidine kinase/ligand-binding sensor domain-containing protein
MEERFGLKVKWVKEAFLNLFLKLYKVVVDFFSKKLIGNHYLRRYLTILFFCVAGIVHLYAQEQYSRFEHLTVNDGLSSNRIWFIFRDSKDYLWIGTDGGLDKYDCNQVLKYRYDEKQTGTISSNNIRCIYEDREKNLWFGTTDGLNLYDRTKDKFKVFKNNPADINSINSNSISSILEDKKGNLWIVTDGKCLNKLVSETQTFIRYQFENRREGFNVRPVRMIADDSKGYLWIASFNRGIDRFDPVSGKFTKYDDPTIDFGNNCLKSLYIDNQDKIWITSDGSGFFSYDPITNKFEQFGSKGDGKGTNQNRILDIIPEDDQHLLLAVDQGGINRFDKRSKTFEYIRYDETNNEGLNNNGVWCLYKDREGILWVGTSGGGVNYYNPKRDNFKLFVHNNSNPKSLSNDIALYFCEDSEGMIWIGTDGGGLDVYNPETGNFKVYKHIPSDPYSISGNIVSCLAEDKNHDIWIGTWDAELERYDRKTGRFFHYTPEKNNPSSISGRTIWTILKDHNDNLWLGVFQVGIDLLDTNKRVIERFRTDSGNPNAISSGISRIIYEDSEKNIWVTTADGLNLYDSKNNSFKAYNFPDNDIEAFIRDIDGNLWAGSHSSGIYYCKSDGTLIKTYTTADGLPSNSIRAIIEDNNSLFWISTTNGISRFDRKTQKFRNYSKGDGLQGDEFLRQSFMKTRKGEMYFGGYNGFNSFFPENLKDNDFIPPVYITDFQVFNKPVIFGEPGNQFPTHISEAKEITLNWNQSVFSFSFAAINYIHPKKNQYAYIMEGFEKEWNYTNASRRYVTYTNLDPGKYTFRVKASNNDGIWNEKGVSLRIVILPPWWKTLGFKFLVFFAVFSILAYIFISRIRHLKNQKILLENEVAKKTSELQVKNTALEERQTQIEVQRENLYQLNASKDKFFSIIAHDLKNPFSNIIGLSGILKEELKSGDPKMNEECVEMINVSAVQSLKLLENLLEWAKSQTGKLLFNPMPINLRELYNEEFNLLHEIATGKHIDLINSIPENLTISADRNMIKTVLRNLVSNALKFTHKDGKVEVNAISIGKQVEISVSDNGIGMTKENMGKLFRIDANLLTNGTEDEKGTGLGLFLCKEFIEKHGGKIWVESEVGKGSVFKFILP